jgi:hypothetical protein
MTVATWSLGPPRERAPGPVPIVASTATPTREVTLSRTQRRLMFGEAQGPPDREVGGGLYGRPAQTWDRTLAIDEAHPASLTSKRYRDKFTFCLNELEAPNATA